MQTNVASTSKQLAVFWYIEGQFIGLRDALHGATTTTFGEYMQIDKGHYEVWPFYRRLVAAAREEEYERFPRGRVMFNIRTREFKVCADEKIVNNPTARAELLAWCSLPASTIFDTDEHYQSEG